MGNATLSIWKKLTVSTIFTLMMGCSTHSAFYIEGGSFLDLETHRKYLSSINNHQDFALDDRLFVVTGHRLTEGKGVVISFRNYKRGKLFYTDQGDFEKITIALPSGLPENKGEIKLGIGTDTIVFYSTGSSAFPGRSGCFGYAEEGSILFEVLKSKKISAQIVFKSDLKSPGRWKDCSSVIITRAIIFKPKLVSDLTPWEGSIGAYITTESFP